MDASQTSHSQAITTPTTKASPIAAASRMSERQITHRPENSNNAIEKETRHKPNRPYVGISSIDDDGKAVDTSPKNCVHESTLTLAVITAVVIGGGFL